MKLQWIAALSVTLAAQCAGLLPQSQEMERLSLITTFAVDQTPAEQAISLTAVTGVQASQNKEPEILNGNGPNLTAACYDLRTKRASRCYLGQTGKLLLGETAAHTHLLELLDFVLTDPELRLDTMLYLVRGEAGSGLAASAPKSSGDDPRSDPKGKTIREILSRLSSGEFALIPALSPQEDGTLSPSGWAVAGPEGLAGFLEGDAALGAELLSNQGSGKTASLPNGTVTLSNVRTKVKNQTICCSLSAQATQGNPSQDELERWAEPYLRAALASGWDCWSLQQRQNALHPWNQSPPLSASSIQNWNIQINGKIEGNYERRQENTNQSVQ